MRIHLFPAPRGKAAERSHRGRLRRGLTVVAPTWLCSPVRRIVQTGCFLVFLWLFCYVCWPYTARPARVWNDWRPADVEIGGIPGSPDRSWPGGGPMR